MRTLALFLLLTATAWSQSVIYTIGPLPVAKVKCDTVTAKQALAALQPDSGQIVRKMDNGDFDCNGSVSLSDGLALLYYCLKANATGPKGHFVFQLNDNRTKDSVTITCILVDSIGVKLP